MNTEVRDHDLFLKGALDLLTNSTTADVGATMHLSVTRALSTDTVMRGLVTADTVPRLAVLASGNLQWGTGAAAADTVLSRNNGYLQLDTAAAGSAGLIINNGIVALQGTGSLLSMTEISPEPGVSSADKAKLYLVDNGAGKTVLKVIFSSGVGIVLATQA